MQTQKVISRILIISFLLSLLSWMSIHAESSNNNLSSSEETDQKIWRVVNKCPVNSLYIILRLYNRAVTYRDVEERLPVGSQGSSLVQLRDCAASFGLYARVVKGSPDSLNRCRLPALAHCDEEKETGHYVVILSVGNDEVELIDGTTAMVQTLTASEFRKRWSGHLILFEQRQAWWSYLSIPVGLALLGLGLFLFGRWRRRCLARRTMAESLSNS
jgi:TRAP-type C4-dicarboxylate transport system permease small subunit